MIQRMQSLWLLLGAVAAFLTIRFSFYSGNKLGANQARTFQHLTATSSMLILIITIAIGIMAGVAIFLYKNRKLQMRLALGAMILSLLNPLLYYNASREFVEGSFALTCLIAISIPVFLILAIRGIYKDQKLIKSLDRLR